MYSNGLDTNLWKFDLYLRCCGQNWGSPLLLSCVSLSVHQLTPQNTPPFVFRLMSVLYICHWGCLNSLAHKDCCWPLITIVFFAPNLQTVSSQCLWEVTFFLLYEPVNLSPCRPTLYADIQEEPTGCAPAVFSVSL